MFQLDLSEPLSRRQFLAMRRLCFTTPPVSMVKRLTGEETWTDPITATGTGWVLPAGSTVGGSQVGAGTGKIVNVTAGSLVVTAALHAGRIITLNLATGIAVTLPNATGTGNNFTFFIGTTITSTNTTVISRGAAADVISGVCQMHKATSTYTPFLTAANTNTITLGTSTQTSGGTLGDIIELIDVGLNQWALARCILVGAGTLVTPFSNA